MPQDAVGQPALDVSDNRGLADEEVSAVSPEGGTYTIQVASFDGGYSNDPWMLRVERSPAIPLPTTCTNPHGPGTGVTKPMPVVPAAASTLYLFASKRFGDLYGLQAENDVFSRLQTLAARTDAAGGAVIPVDANAAVLTALNARAPDSCSPAKANDVVRAVGNLLDNPQIVRPSVKYIVVVGRRCRRHPVRAHPRQLRVRERARLREHVLRRLEQPVPEHVRARLPADRRRAGRRQLLGPGAVRPRARGRPPRRDADPDPQPDHPVHQPERRDQPDAGSDDRLRLPLGRRDEDLRGLQGQGGDEQRTGADQQLLDEEQPARGDVPGFEPARCSTRSTPTTTTSARCPPTRTPRSARRSSTRRPISRAARRPGASSSRWAAIRPSRCPTSSSAAR